MALGRLPAVFPSFTLGWNMETGATAGGVVVGMSFGEILGTAFKTWSGQTGWLGWAVSAIGKSVVGAGAIYVSKGAATLGKLLGFGAALGAAVSVVLEALGLVFPEGFAGLGRSLGEALRGYGVGGAPSYGYTPSAQVVTPMAAMGGIKYS